jgi:hypothetical protein
MIRSKEDYSQWYWDLYRWFKWEAKYAHKNLWRGIKNLWRWFPIIWKDRDWDHEYILKVLKFKIEKNADYIEKNNRYVGCERDVQRMRTCARLIDLISDDHYSAEMHTYWETKLRFEPIEGDEDHKSLEIDDIRVDLDAYIAKYPNDARRAMSHKILLRHPEEEITEKRIAITMSFLRHERARRILFSLMDRNIEGWWD